MSVNIGLPNGATSEELSYHAITASLAYVKKAHPDAYQDLICKCLDSSYKINKNPYREEFSLQILRKLELIDQDDERVYETVKNIVLAIVVSNSNRDLKEICQTKV